MYDHGYLTSAFIVLLSFSCATCSLSDVTSDVFTTKSTGITAAFGDIDGNKATDIFVISNDGRSVDILEADINIGQENAKFQKKQFLLSKGDDAQIVGIVPGDFNRDSQMDVLVMRKAKKDDEVKVEIYHGNDDSGKPFLTVNETFRDQPAVIDGNGDMSPDLFGETNDGKRGLWSFNANETYSVQYYSDGLTPLKVPQSSAFMDINGDLTADLCAVTQDPVDKTVALEMWLNVKGQLTHVHNVTAPKMAVYGQASFVDLGGRSEMNIVLPGCLDDACKDSVIYVWSHNKYSQDAENGTWHKLDVNFKKGTDRVTSFSSQLPGVPTWLYTPIVLRMGDFNLDGYPDAVAVLRDTHGSTSNVSAFLLYNVACGSECEGFSRTFSIDYQHPLQKNTPALVTFFDLMENGVLDILITEVQADGTIMIRALKQEFSADASFLKILVLSGLCHKNCPHGHSPYGVNQVGPTATFESTTPTGGDQIGIGSQLSQSAHMSLQLPFLLFGLGQTPNFVDDLQVGIPYPPEQKRRVHSWSAIIPNSQVIITPYPQGDPSNWKHELFVTPSRLVLLTGVSLLGTCAVIAIIVGLLHWRERIEDKKEKLQEAQRFHFDAM